MMRIVVGLYLIYTLNNISWAGRSMTSEFKRKVNIYKNQWMHCLDWKLNQIRSKIMHDLFNYILIIQMLKRHGKNYILYI